MISGDPTTCSTYREEVAVDVSVRAFCHCMGNIIEEEQRENGCISDMAQISYAGTLEDNS